MKAKITIGIALLLLGWSLPVVAQSTAYANIYATVIAPVQFSKTNDMTFDDIQLSKKSTSLSIRTGKNVSADLKMSQNGTATLASFSITDSNHTTFDITLPTENIKISDGNANTMTVSNFSSSQTLSGSLYATTRNINVGADLQIPENLTAGNYSTQNSFPVTLNYN